MLMAASFDPPPFPTTAEGGSLAVPGAEGRAAEEDAPDWANAMADVMTATAAREHTNLSFMGFALTPWITAFIYFQNFPNVELSQPSEWITRTYWRLHPLFILRTSIGQA